MAGLPKQIQKQIKDGALIEEGIRKELEGKGGKLDEDNQTQAEIDALLNSVDPQEAEEKPDANVTELHPKPKGGDPDLAPDSAEQKPERADWKQKYNVLKGKYDAEVPRLSENLRDANTRITKLEDSLAGLAKPQQAEPVDDKPTFTQEEIADYGEDLLDVIGRKAREIATKEFVPAMGELRNQISSLEKQLGQTGQRVAKQEQNEVFAVLDRDVKDWRKINTSPQFFEWLETRDAFSGHTRKDMMLNAFTAKDAPRVRAFFDKFVEENAAVVPSAAPAPADQAGNTGRLSLDDYVAPGTPRSGGQSDAPKNKRIWSNKEVGKFYSDCQKGHYKKRPEDKARIEADIVAATREGRIQN